MFRKILVVLALTFLSTSVLADVLVINQSPPASVMTGLTQSVKDTIKSPPTQFYQSRDCADAANVYKDSKDAVLVYETMMVAASASKGLDCQVKFDKDEVVAYSWQSFSVCRLPATSPTLTDATLFGMAGMHPYKNWILEFNAKNNANLTVVPGSGSKATLASLLSKDIEWGFIATAVATDAEAQGLIKCNYTTDPTATNYLGKVYKHPLADLRIKILILAKGTHTKEIRQDLSTSEFHAYLTRFGYKAVINTLAQKDVTRYDDEYQVLKKAYAE